MTRNSASWRPASRAAVCACSTATGEMSIPRTEAASAPITTACGSAPHAVFEQVGARRDDPGPRSGSPRSSRESPRSTCRRRPASRPRSGGRGTPARSPSAAPRRARRGRYRRPRGRPVVSRRDPVGWRRARAGDDAGRERPPRSRVRPRGGADASPRARRDGAPAARPAPARRRRGGRGPTTPSA